MPDGGTRDTAPVHLWGEEAREQTLAVEMEDIELGFRVSWELLMEDLATVYTSEDDRARGLAVALVGRIANGQRQRGWPVVLPLDLGVIPDRSDK